MAKKIGQVNESTRKVETGKPRKVKEVPWPVTRVDTRWKKIRRALWD
jgi:hypothetical protein